MNLVETFNPLERFTVCVNGDDLEIRYPIYADNGKWHYGYTQINSDEIGVAELLDLIASIRREVNGVR